MDFRQEPGVAVPIVDLDKQAVEPGLQQGQEGDRVGTLPVPAEGEGEGGAVEGGLPLVVRREVQEGGGQGGGVLKDKLPQEEGRPLGQVHQGLLPQPGTAEEGHVPLAGGEGTPVVELLEGRLQGHVGGDAQQAHALQVDGLLGGVDEFHADLRRHGGGGEGAGQGDLQGFQGVAQDVPALQGRLGGAVELRVQEVSSGVGHLAPGGEQGGSGGEGRLERGDGGGVPFPSLTALGEVAIGNLGAVQVHGQFLDQADPADIGLASLGEDHVKAEKGDGVLPLGVSQEGVDVLPPARHRPPVEAGLLRGGGAVAGEIDGEGGRVPLVVDDQVVVVLRPQGQLRGREEVGVAVPHAAEPLPGDRLAGDEIQGAEAQEAAGLPEVPLLAGKGKGEEKEKEGRQGLGHGGQGLQGKRGRRGKGNASCGRDGRHGSGKAGMAWHPWTGMRQYYIPPHGNAPAGEGRERARVFPGIPGISGNRESGDIFWGFLRFRLHPAACRPFPASPCNPNPPLPLETSP